MCKNPTILIQRHEKTSCLQGNVTRPAETFEVDIHLSPWSNSVSSSLIPSDLVRTTFVHPCNTRQARRAYTGSAGWCCGFWRQWGAEENWSNGWWFQELTEKTENTHQLMLDYMRRVRYRTGGLTNCRPEYKVPCQVGFGHFGLAQGKIMV